MHHKTTLTGAAAMLVAIGFVTSVPAQAKRLNRSECKAACNQNAPDPAACYVKYACDSQPDGPVDKNRINNEIQTYNSKYRGGGGQAGSVGYK
jgi:hypothetical protein